MGIRYARRPKFLSRTTSLGKNLRIIAHRGNLTGQSSYENSPTLIDFCLNKSVECEIDLWAQNGTLLLGHDFGQYEVDVNWLFKRRQSLWIHCKNYEAPSVMSYLGENSFNFFWHQRDNYTLTCKRFVWVYPGEKVLSGSVYVLPEI